MPVKANILDRDGRRTLQLNDEGAAHVVVHPHPPRNEDLISLPFRARFEDAAGSTDMAVNGSSTPVAFNVSALVGIDLYIKYISLAIGDGGSPALNKFGALTALTNGVQWCWSSQDKGTIILHDGIKTNLEFIRVGSDTAGVGTGTDAFLSDVSGGGSEKSYLPSIDLAELFGLPYGIRLRASTEDRLFFNVQDDLSGLTTFDAIAYGLKI